MQRHLARRVVRACGFGGSTARAAAPKQLCRHRPRPRALTSATAPASLSSQYRRGARPEDAAAVAVRSLHGSRGGGARDEPRGEAVVAAAPEAGGVAESSIGAVSSSERRGESRRQERVCLGAAAEDDQQRDNDDGEGDGDNAAGADEDAASVRDALVAEALNHHVPQLGFTADAVAAAASSLSLSPATHAMLARGPVELVEALHERNTRTMADLLRADDLTLADYDDDDDDLGNDGEQQEQRGERQRQRHLSVREKLLAAMKIRIRLQQPYRAHYAQALALQAMPQNALRAAQLTALMVDEMWHWAGDRSADFSWYTKRATLAAIYHATELHWMSAADGGGGGGGDERDTWRFAEGALADGARGGAAIGQAVREASTLMRAAGQTASSLLASIRRGY